MVSNLDQTIAASSRHESGSGIVFRKSVGSYDVRLDGQIIACSISNMLRKELVYPLADPTSFRRRVMAVRDIRVVDPVSVGDEVRFVLAEDGSAMITEVLPRRNKLARIAAGAKPLEQVIAANVDQVVIVFAAAQPAPKWNLLDRYLVSTESSGLPALVCITKLDLAEDGLQDEVMLYRRIGYRVLVTSTVTGEGIREFSDALKGQASVLVGKSGVGKTSLLNAVEPGLGLRVNAVSQATSKGRHTTSHIQMFPLHAGGSVVDTPGVREFGLWQVDGRDIALFFPEMRPLVGTCQFGLDCGHATEPGCAIKHAVADGRISARRYESMLKLEVE